MKITIISNIPLLLTFGIVRNFGVGHLSRKIRKTWWE